MINVLYCNVRFGWFNPARGIFCLRIRDTLDVTLFLLGCDRAQNGDAKKVTGWVLTCTMSH